MITIVLKAAMIKVLSLSQIQNLPTRRPFFLFCSISLILTPIAGLESIWVDYGRSKTCSRLSPFLVTKPSVCVFFFCVLLSDSFLTKAIFSPSITYFDYEAFSVASPFGQTVVPGMDCHLFPSWQTGNSAQ